MQGYSYLRAYMAGVTVPTLFLLVVVTAFTVFRLTSHVAAPIERIVIFPMAAVPNAWGAWNMLYVWLLPRRRLPIGIHGAILPFLLAPAGVLLAQATEIGFVTLGRAATGFPIALIVYYLAWKHLVGFLNRLVGIS
jgi:hypothetical protein